MLRPPPSPWAGILSSPQAHMSNADDIAGPVCRAVQAILFSLGSRLSLSAPLCVVSQTTAACVWGQWSGCMQLGNLYPRLGSIDFALAATSEGHANRSGPCSGCAMEI